MSIIIRCEVNGLVFSISFVELVAVLFVVFVRFPGLFSPGILKVCVDKASSRKNCFNTPISIRSSIKLRITSKTRKVQVLQSRKAAECTP